MSLRAWASALGGTVSGASIVCPGPGHSHKDRSLSVKLNASAPGGFLVYSHAGDDFAACRDHVRSRVGLPAFAPQIGAPASMPKITEALEPAPNIDYALRIWCEAADIHGTIAEHYLNSRQPCFKVSSFVPVRIGTSAGNDRLDARRSYR